MHCTVVTPDRQITMAALTNSFVITEKAADMKSMKSMKITFMEALKQHRKVLDSLLEMLLHVELDNKCVVRFKLWLTSCALNTLLVCIVA